MLIVSSLALMAVGAFFAVRHGLLAYLRRSGGRPESATQQTGPSSDGRHKGITLLGFVLVVAGLLSLLVAISQRTT